MGLRKTLPEIYLMVGRERVKPPPVFVFPWSPGYNFPDCQVISPERTVATRVIHKKSGVGWNAESCRDHVYIGKPGAGFA